MSSLDPIQLANELHDGVIQEMSALLLQLETYQRRLEKDPVAAQADLSRIKLQLRDTLRHIRQIVTRLRAKD
jgi:signal transduction histidine kinase